MASKTQTRVGITGIDGLIGWHLRCRLSSEPGRFLVLAAGRETFEEPDLLERFVSDCDVVIHLAGMNRGDTDELERTNVRLARDLVSAFEHSGSTPQLLFSSSTHQDSDSAYGRSKKRARDLFRRWADENNADFANLILPHVYGEMGRPFYNSVVSTFCHQLAAGEEPRIETDGDLELLHAQEVAMLVKQVIGERRSGDVRPQGEPIRVSEMLARLKGLLKSYRSDIFPDVGSEFDLRLFNTLRSYLYPTFYPRGLELRSDERGQLFEAVKTVHGGQAFLSTTKPGITRGNHYHFDKIERFLVVGGNAVIRIRRLFDDHVAEFEVSGSEPAYVDMPTLHTHSITNTGSQDLLTLFWSHEIFDPNHPDTYFADVLQEGSMQ